MIILSDNFDTALGTIQTWAETESCSYLKNQDKFKFSSHGYDVYLQSFDLKQIWSPEEMEYESGKGWRWFIQKTRSENEQLIIFCKLDSPANDVEWGSSSGEHLDAIEIENTIHHLHIGTEDGEMMRYRAEASDWMPARLQGELEFFKSFTEYTDFGFKTTVPSLKQGEKIYFHFMVAFNTIKQSKDYPNERDISTWIAVDQYKNRLDQKLTFTTSNNGFTL